MRLLLIPFVVALDVVIGVWAWSTFGQGLWLVGSVVVLITIGVNFAALMVKGTALRWMLPTLALMTAFTLAPIVYTGFIALTNYNGVHLLTQQQAVVALERQSFVPEGVSPYDWAAYEHADGTLALYLVPKVGEELVVPDDATVDGDQIEGGENAGDVTHEPGIGEIEGDETEEGTPSGGEPTGTPTDEDAQPISDSDVFTRADGTSEEASPGAGIFGAADDEGFPTEIEGYTRLDAIQSVTRIGEITDTEFGSQPTIYRVLSASQAAPILSTFEVDQSTGVVTDRRDGVAYAPTPEGYFTAADGTRLTPAYQTVVGVANFVELFANEKIRSPFLQILLWTVLFSVLVVALQFVLGLIYAVVLNGRAVHPVIARVVRAVLLLPYVIPAYLMILTWSALFNAQTGLIPEALESLFGLDPSWVLTGNGARAAMLLVGVWLGFPYFLLINTGSLQAIPGELIEAASVDGASPWRRFTSIVFPLLMRGIAPLIVLAAAFNFNNFLVAYLLFSGGPPKVNSQVPAGETDLLISFTYKLSFDFGGNEYAMAAVVTTLIFFALTPIVLSQLRYYNAWRKED
jgi:ABC-type sugar transport system permease subunit